jgi:hypothetical protein
MLKKLMIGIVAIVLLSGAVFLNAQEVLEIPKAQKQQQQKVQQKRRQKADKKKGQQIKQKTAKAEKGVQGAKSRAQGGQKTKGQRPRSKHPAGQQLNRVQMFQRWFSGMKKAYREKDMEKMGQLLRTMEQR